MSVQRRKLTRDEALLWLNDHLDRLVYVTVCAEKGDRDLPVVTGTGTLRHWHHDATSRQVMGAARDELSGCTRCRVTGVGRSGGGVGIDVSDLDGAWLYDEGSKRIELV